MDFKTNELEFKAIIKANQLLSKNCIDYPDEINIENIALLENCIIKESSLQGHLGRILSTSETAVITVEESLELGHKNFVKMHELGHYVFEKTLSILSCDDSDLRNSKNFKEALPNQFAAEFLMKRDWFTEFISGKELDFNLMIETSNFFNTSLMSCCIRLTQLTDKAVAFVFTRDGKIEWKALSTSFPFWKFNNKLNDLSYTSDYFKNGKRVTTVNEVDVDAWFRNDNARRAGDRILEENFYMPKYNGVLTMLKGGDE